jgi:hypothetical protein
MDERSWGSPVGSSVREPLQFDDFSVRMSGLAPADGSFNVWVEGATRAGAMRPEDGSRCTFDPSRFWSRPEQGQGGLVGRLERRSFEEPELHELGLMLTELALPDGRVRDLFKASLAALGPGHGLRLRLRIDAPQLLRLPWEFLALPEAWGEPQHTDFLALRRNVSIVRTDTVEAPSRDLPERDRVLLVGALSSPEDQDDLNVDRDRRYVEEVAAALNEATDRTWLTTRWCARPTTRDRLVQALQGGADVFHFAGHGRFAVTTRTGSILLETEDGSSDEYAGQQLAQLLRDSGVRLAVLGACETGRRDGENVWSGVAPALTRQRIPAVIANQFKIEDRNATLLSGRGYPLLFAGFTVDEALFEARQAIYQQAGILNRDWGAPQLYLDDGKGVLFPRAQPAASDDTARTLVRVAATLGVVKGKVVVARVGSIEGPARVDVTTGADTVEHEGEFIGLDLGSLRSRKEGADVEPGS